jgi:hypothetical protein
MFTIFIKSKVHLDLQKNNLYKGVPWETYYKGKIWKLNSTFFKVDLYNCNNKFLEHDNFHLLKKQWSFQEDSIYKYSIMVVNCKFVCFFRFVFSKLKHIGRLSFLEKKCHNFLLTTLFYMNESFPYSLRFQRATQKSRAKLNKKLVCTRLS